MALHGVGGEQVVWRRKRWEALRQLAAQEYGEDASSCFLASGECVFDLQAIGKAAASAGEEVQSQDNGRLTIWFPSQEGRRYIIGVDAAGGGSEGDYACAEVIERTIGLQCAELRGHLSHVEFARRGADPGRDFGWGMVGVGGHDQGYGG